MDIAASNWTEADASNLTAAPDGWPEGMAPSGVNDFGRAMMGAIKRWYDWTIPIVTGGTSTAYTLSYSVAPGALVDGMSHLVQFNAVNGAAPTLNVNALGAKPLHFWASGGWGAFPANMVAVDQVVRVTYNAAAGTYRAIGLPMVLQQTVSGVASIDFAGIPANVKNLEVTFDVVAVTNNVGVLMQFYNSVGVLDAGASSYGYLHTQLNTLPTGGALVSTSTAGIALSSAQSNSAVLGASGAARIQNIQGVKDTQCVISDSFQDNTPLVNILNGTGWRNANGPITGIRIIATGGNISGTVTVAAK